MQPGYSNVNTEDYEPEPDPRKPVSAEFSAIAWTAWMAAPGLGIYLLWDPNPVWFLVFFAAGVLFQLTLMAHRLSGF